MGEKSEAVLQNDPGKPLKEETEKEAHLYSEFPITL